MLQEFSRKQLDGLQKVRAALKPDLVIILNWNEDELPVVQQTVSHTRPHEKVWAYRLADGLPVFWTYHPRGMPSIGGPSVVIDVIAGEFAKLL